MSTTTNPSRQKLDRAIIGGAIGLGIVFAFVGCFAGGNNDSHADLESVNQCETRIGKLLKAPATANYDSTTSGNGNTWTVTGTVDAENSFGANVQADYQCTVIMNRNNTATTTVDYLNE